MKRRVLPLFLATVVAMAGISGLGALAPALARSLEAVICAPGFSNCQAIPVLFRGSTVGTLPLPAFGIQTGSQRVSSLPSGNTAAGTILQGTGTPGATLQIWYITTPANACQGPPIASTVVAGNGTWSVFTPHDPPETIEYYEANQVMSNPPRFSGCTSAVSGASLGVAGAPVLVGTQPTSPASTNQISVFGYGPQHPGVTFTINFYFNNPNCTGSPNTTGTVDPNTGGFSVPMAVPASATTTIYANIVDNFGDWGPCSSSLTVSGLPTSVVFQSTAAAGNAWITGSTPQSPSSNQNPTIFGQSSGLAAGTQVKIFDNAGCQGGGGVGQREMGTGAVDGSGFWSITSATITATTTYWVGWGYNIGSVGCNSGGAFTYTLQGSTPTGSITLNLQSGGTFPTFNGTVTPAQIGARVYLYIDACAAANVAGYSATNSAGFYVVQSSVGIGSPRLFFANAQLPNGVFTPCSAAVVASP